VTGRRDPAVNPTSLLGQLRARLPERYLLERLVGQGGSASVFLATDQHLSRRVAIKVLDPELASGVTAERFLREIRFMASLQHPNIVPLLDGGQADELLYAVMPYIEGATLRESLMDGPMEIAEAARIIATMADALDYAHRVPLVHRDIKPENILVSQGKPLLADFGVARAIGLAGDGLTAAGSIIGTLIYMSPEQATASSNVDGRSDIYSLGCVLYELLTGRPPFVGPDMGTIFQLKWSGTAPPIRALRPEVPQEVVACAERMMAVDPDRRFQHAGEVAAILGPAADRARSAAPLRPATRPANRALLVAAGLALAALLLTLLQIWW
jgi:serine/threonine-protein kinase